MCQDVPESSLTNTAFSDLALLLEIRECYIFSLDTRGSLTSSENHKSQKNRRVQNMEKSLLDISGGFFLSYSALASEANLNNYNSFPTASSFFWALKSNIAVKSTGLQQERKESVLRTQGYTPWRKKLFTFPVREETMGK